MLERLAASARDLVVRAQDEARALGHPAIADDHLLLARARDGGPAGTVLREAGVTRDALAARIATGSAHTSGQVPFAPSARQALEDAAALAGGDEVQAGHIAAALTTAPAWARTGVDPKRLRVMIPADGAGPDATPTASDPAVQGPVTLPPEPWFRPPG